MSVLAEWPPKQDPFVCSVCHKPGIGAPHAQTHPGACRLEGNRRRTRAWTADRTADRAAKRSRERAATI